MKLYIVRDNEEPKTYVFTTQKQIKSLVLQDLAREKKEGNRYVRGIKTVREYLEDWCDWFTITVYDVDNDTTSKEQDLYDFFNFE